MAAKKRSKKNTEPARKRGRPTVFNEVVQEKILALAKQGATDVELAEAIGVSDRTIRYWKVQHADFFPALKECKDLADQMVEASLFQRACGYSHPAEKILTNFNRFTGEVEVERVQYIEHYPPDTVAAIFWLKNRQPERWREKPDPNPPPTDQQTTIVYEAEWGGSGEPPTPGINSGSDEDGEA